jgi:GT2 family glycosyltransferase
MRIEGQREGTTDRVSVLRLPPAVRDSPPRIALDVLVLVACFNRRETTLAALRGLVAQRVAHQLNVGAVLVDAGSSDGTVEAVRSEFPWVEIVQGDPSMYWSASMERAQHCGLARAEPRFLLWLNDDIELEENALSRLVEVASIAGGDCVIAGALLDPRTGVTTYTGMRRTGRRPTRLALVHPSASPQRIDTFNGNLVVVPRSVYDVVGAVDGRFGHAYGDVDYGFRLAKLGFRSILAPGHFGSCPRNESTATWCDPQLSRRSRLSLLFGPKGTPVRPHARFVRRHAPVAWPAYVVGGYVKSGWAIARRRAVRSWDTAPRIDVASRSIPRELER